MERLGFSPKLKRLTQAAMPFRCKVRLENGNVVGGWVTGRKLNHPMVQVSEINTIANFGISWHLASRLMWGTVPFVKL